MVEENRKEPGVEGSESNSALTLSEANRTERARVETLTPSARDERPNEDRVQTPVQGARLRMVSERKLQANRANAKKSTGPRTARGKAYSSRNAQKHGLLSQASLFAPDGTPIDPELRALWTRLREKYGKDDADTDELLRTVVSEWSHQRRAAELEEGCLQNAMDDSTSTVSLSKLQRYRTKSQRSLLRNLARLRRGPEKTP